MSRKRHLNHPWVFRLPNSHWKPSSEEQSRLAMGVLEIAKKPGATFKGIEFDAVWTNGAIGLGVRKGIFGEQQHFSWSDAREMVDGILPEPRVPRRRPRLLKRGKRKSRG